MKNPNNPDPINHKSVPLWVLIVLAISCLTSCFRDHQSETIVSPTGRYSIKTTVNRTEKLKDNYADVRVHLFNKEGKEISELNTKTGDFNKWAVGWDVDSDILIIQSSDIGNSAWKIENKKFVKIKMTNRLKQRAGQLKDEKYR